jgi:hypothetical protein
MLNFFLKLFKLPRAVVLVDYENRVAVFKTRDYPESGALVLYRDNYTTLLTIDSFTKNGDVYNLQTPRGLYLLYYK